jgi:alpha-L-fucosidase
MTMNGHWGYNKFDHKFKNSEDLIQKLVDIASKGGNFLLNVGPTPEGEIPPESVARLHDIAKWMDVNGDSIYGTQAGPFEKLAWGRCTQRTINPSGPVTRLYLHVFNWPKSGRLVVPGLYNETAAASILGDTSRQNISISRQGADVVLSVPSTCPDPIDTVVVLDIIGKPDVAIPPVIQATSDIFVDTLPVTAIANRENITLRYSLSGNPTENSPPVTGPIKLSATSTIAVQAFRNDRPVSPVARKTFTKTKPLPPVEANAKTPGVSFAYYEGDWKNVPDFSKLEPKLKGTTKAFDRRPRKQEEHFGFRYTGFIKVEKADAYTFFTDSDDGSMLSIDGKLVVNNDGLHSLQERSGAIALAPGLHAVTVDFFEQTGGHELKVAWSSTSFAKKPLPASDLLTSP